MRIKFDVYKEYKAGYCTRHITPTIFIGDTFWIHNYMPNQTTRTFVIGIQWWSFVAEIIFQFPERKQQQ